MRVRHVLDRIRDQLARRQAVEHPVMAHGDPVIDRDRVELLGHAAGLLDFARDQLAEIFQVDVPGHELRERIGDGDDRLVKIRIGHPGSAPEAACAGHVAAMRGGS